MVFPRLKPAHKKQLALIEPRLDEQDLPMYPCSVRLEDGRIVDCVYLIEATNFLVRNGGLMPPDRAISPEGVDLIMESPSRLPAHLVRQILSEGESGMGYYAFTVVFSWWCRREYATGFPDFIKYPAAKCPWISKGYCRTSTADGHRVKRNRTSIGAYSQFDRWDLRFFIPERGSPLISPECC